MRKVLDRNLMKQAEELIKSKPLLKGYIEDKGIVLDSKNRIICPFHGDTDPSLKISEEGDMWKCFGCGKYGGFVNFYKEYNELIKGREIKYATAIESILREYNLPIKTIYQKESKIVLNIEHIEFNSVKPKAQSFNSPVEDIRILTKRGDREGIIDFLKNLQIGMDTDVEYMGEKVSLNEIIQGTI